MKFKIHKPLLPRISSLQLVLSIIAFFIFLLLFKTEINIIVPYQYACKEEELNPEYLTYTNTRDNYVNNCVKHAKEEHPKDFIRYNKDLEMEVESSYAVNQQRLDCEREFNIENIALNIPPKTLSKDTTCSNSRVVSCIAFFGYCVYKQDNKNIIQKK